MPGEKQMTSATSGLDAGRFVDTHVHFHACKPGALPKVAEWMGANDIRRVFNMPLEQSLPRDDGERRGMNENYAKYKGVIERFCIIEPGEVSSAQEAVEILKREMRDGAVGFGEHYGRDLFIDDEKNMRLYAGCAKTGLPVLFHMDRTCNKDEKGLPHLESALGSNPDCTFIAHSDFWRSGYLDGSAEDLLQKYPNLYADISCTVKRATVFKGDLKEGREFVIRNVDKLFFGSDSGWWSFGKAAMPEFALIDKLNLPDEVEVKLLRGNAARLFPVGK
jgi:predicted TIM-barrel fold metal-dependent hydrolase